MTTPAKLISEKHENLAPKKEDLPTDTKKVRKKLKTNDPQYQFKLEFCETKF